MTHPATEQEKWLRNFCPAPGGHTRLFCFPYAGGAASYFYRYATALAPRIEVQAIQYPGRQERHREPCAGTITELADSIVAAMRHLTDRPYAFFGHSMGAIVAYEVTRRLLSEGQAGPQWLLVSAQRAPSRQRPGNVHLRSDQSIIEELRSLGGTDSRWLDDPDLVATILPPIRNDYRAIETYTYVPGQPLTCPVTALMADDDCYTSVPDVAAWRAHTTASFDLRVFSGGHFFLDSCCPEVTSLISGSLEGAAAVG